MKILITGASSYVGARIFFDLQDKHHLLGTYYSNKISTKFIQLDLTQPKNVRAVVTTFNPDLIIHVANFPNSKYEDIDAYTKLNFEATKSIVAAANQVDAKVTFISGVAALYDYDIYCQLKAASEDEVRKTTAGYLLLRPSLVLGISPNQTNDRTFNRWLKAVDQNKKTLEQDDTWKFHPTYIGHFSQIIQQVIDQEQWNSELPVIISSVQSEYSIAARVLTEFGLEVTPTNKRSELDLVELGEEKLSQFSLNPNWKNYDDFVETLITEIRNRNEYLL